MTDEKPRMRNAAYLACTFRGKPPDINSSDIMRMGPDRSVAVSVWRPCVEATAAHVPRLPYAASQGV